MDYIIDFSYVGLGFNYGKHDLSHIHRLLVGHSDSLLKFQNSHQLAIL